MRKRGGKSPPLSPSPPAAKHQRVEGGMSHNAHEGSQTYRRWRARDDIETAIRLVTASGTRTEWVDERYDVSPIHDAERQVCVNWLQGIEFLVPGEDDERWDRIRKNWVSFLAATSAKPDARLAPNRKVVRFYDDDDLDMDEDGDVGESAEAKRRRFRADRTQRRTIQKAFWQGMDGLEGLSERWPRDARVLVNERIEGKDAGPYESLAAKCKLRRRRRFNSIWTGLVCFLVHSQDEGTLAEMGLHLSEEQVDDILDVMQAATPLMSWNQRGLAASTWGLLLPAICKIGATPSDNVVLWWVAILVRSALSGQEEKPDYISQGQFNMNILPMDLDLGERLEAIIHYSKVLFFHQTFSNWEGKPRWREEIIRDMDEVSLDWLDKDDDVRPAPGADKRTCASAAWKALLKHLQERINDWMDPLHDSALKEVVRLRKLLRRAREEKSNSK